nr:MAG TPA: hypothetical protein [Caudoviricetes sp.]
MLIYFSLMIVQIVIFVRFTTQQRGQGGCYP